MTEQETPELTFPGMLAEYADWAWRRRAELGLREWWAPVIGLAAAAVVGVVLAISLVWALVSGLARGVETWLAGGADWLQGTAVWSMLADPVRRFLGGHAAGLPLSEQTLWWTWASAGVVLFLLAVMGVVGARIGWVLYGASTAAMVWVGTSTTSRPVATALVVLAWVVLSFLALRRVRPYQPVIVTARVHD